MLTALQASEEKKSSHDFLYLTCQGFYSLCLTFLPFPYKSCLQFLSVMTTSLYFPCYMKSALKWFFCCSSSVLLYLFNEKLHALL